MRTTDEVIIDIMNGNKASVAKLDKVSESQAGV